MANDDKKDDPEKGFVIKDKRFSAKKEDTAPAAEEIKREAGAKEQAAKSPAEPQAPGPGGGDTSEQEPPLPEINFLNFLLSLHTSALIQLGEIQDPGTGQPSKNLPVARQTIDLIGMLKEKTKGNVTEQEERMLENILYDLRMRFVKASG
jgi:hypothetical protein